MSDQASDQPKVRPTVNPWVIAMTVTLATFMEILDTSIANVSLPHIAGGLSTGLDESTWVLSSYLVANAIVLPISAWLSTVFGRKRFYMTCVFLFTVSSFLCGLAPSLGMLIFFRVLQGIGGGGLAPSEQAILVDTFPGEKRAGAFAVYSMAIVLAPAIGPTLGGWITDNFSWRWIFFINIPVGILSLFLTHYLIFDPPEMDAEVKANKGNLKVDYIGILLVAIGFGCLEVVLDKGQRDDWFSSSFITTFAVIATCAIVAGVIWETHYDDPAVDLSLLKERNFALASIFYFLFGFILFGSTVLIPEMLQALFGYTATDAGMVLSPGALVIVFMAPIVVKLMPKVGAKNMIGMGFFIIGVSMIHISHFDLEIDYRTAMYARILQGFGIAFLFVPTSAVAYSYLPKEKNNKASSLTNLFRNLGGSFGIAFVTTVSQRRAQFHQNVLASHVSTYSNNSASSLSGLVSTLLHAGVSPGQAVMKAQALLYQSLSVQSSLLGYLDAFVLLGLFSFAAMPLAFLIKKMNPAKAATAGAH